MPTNVRRVFLRAHTLVMESSLGLRLTAWKMDSATGAAPPGVGGSVSGRLDGHAVSQQATAPLL